MTIALDATYSLGHNLSGVGVYSREILFGLATSQPATHFRWCYRPHRFLRARRQPRPPNAGIAPLFDSLPAWPAQLFHGLNQRMPARRPRRTVCTFHDLFVMTSEYSTPEFRARFTGQARQAAARADLLICVSNFTAGQVRDLLGVPESRLRVIPHGTLPPPAIDDSQRQPLILHVGAMQRRKNLVRLVAAFDRHVPAPWRLVLAGADGFDAEPIHQRIAASPARDRIETLGWVDDQQLDALYRRASVFAFPSLDEGFGIPVLEAMAHGLPVVSSNRSALPEACGDAAILVDPLEEEALGAALGELISSPQRRAKLASDGRARAREYSWERAVNATWRVYGELLAP